MSIILVGNGKTLLNSSLGAKIDDFDKVVRFNNFNLQKEYYKDVGSRTNYICRRSCHDIKWFKPESFELIYNFVTYCTISPGMQMVANLVKRTYKEKYIEVTQQECKAIGEDIGLEQPVKERASVGVLAIGYFVRAAIEETYVDSDIWICGFDNIVEPNFESPLAHYFPKNPVDAKYHNWQKETVYIQRLINEGKVKLLK